MAQRKIINMDEEPLLRRVSKPVTEFDDRLKQLVADMKETMRLENGAGLAAPQIGILKRVIICDINGEIITFVNPEILTVSEERLTEYEGCLSVLGKRGLVPRPAKLTVKAQDVSGKHFKFNATMFAARVLCHEIDHLDGILYIDRADGVENI